MEAEMEVGKEIEGEMEDWMDTTGKDYGDENTGVANVVNSLDMITWWAMLTFFHCDESPIYNALL